MFTKDQKIWIIRNFHHQKVYISLEDHSFLTSNFSSHFKNDVYWSPDNPSNIKEVRDQGVSKVMAWVGMVDGRVLPITWFQGSVTGQNYLEMLENKVWPAVKSVATKKKYWFQQDGARVHTTNDCLAFLQDKFQGRVISNRLNFFWPAKSPDLNPLDFYFWGVAEARFRKEKPKTIVELKAVVENFGGELCWRNLEGNTVECC